MGISISDRIQTAINYMDQRKYDYALSEVCIAIDITSQNNAHKNKSSRSLYQEFVRSRMWIILITGMGGVISQSIRIPFSHPDIKNDDQGYCTFEQIVYYVMRCGFVHGTGESSNINWNWNVQIAIDSNGSLQISPSFIWGLMLTVISCPINKDEHVNDTAWISTMTFKYLVNDLWGKESSLHNMVKSAYNVDFQPTTQS